VPLAAASTCLPALSFPLQSDREVKKNQLQQPREGTAPVPVPTGPVSLGLCRCLSWSRRCGVEQRTGTGGDEKNPACQNRVEGGMEREEMLQLIFLSAFPRKNLALQREMGNRPAPRDAPGFESRPGVLPARGGWALPPPLRRGGSRRRDGRRPPLARGAAGQWHKAMLVPGWWAGRQSRSQSPRPNAAGRALRCAHPVPCPAVWETGKSFSRGRHPSPTIMPEFQDISHLY